MQSEMNKFSLTDSIHSERIIIMIMTRKAEPGRGESGTEPGMR